MGIINDIKSLEGKEDKAHLLHALDRISWFIENVHAELQEVKASEVPADANAGSMILPVTALVNGAVPFYPLLPRNARRSKAVIIAGSNNVYLATRDLTNDPSVGQFFTQGQTNATTPLTAPSLIVATGTFTYESAGPLWVANPMTSVIGVGYVEYIYHTASRPIGSIDGIPRLLSDVYKNGELAGFIRHPDDEGRE